MPQSDTIVRGIHSLADAADVVARHYRLSSEVVIEHYPAPCRFGLKAEPSGVFAYQFFDEAGGNCGYYLVDLDSVHVLSTPRRWGLPKPSVCRINPNRLSLLTN